MDRFQSSAAEIEERMRDADIAVTAKRIDRLEEAVLNIERATMKVEAALHALPKGMQRKMAREYHPPDSGV